MKITSIKLIKHRIFANFRWAGRGLDDFLRYNLIYGWNYSGKTTISNLFQLIEEGNDLSEDNATFVCEDIGDIDLTSLSAIATLPSVRVFNRRFIENHVSFTSDNLTSPITVVIGKSAPERQRLLEEKRVESGLKSNEIGKLDKAAKKAIKSSEEYGSEQAKTINTRLGKPGNPYWTYRRNQFEKDCTKATTTIMLSDEDYDANLVKKDATSKEDIDLLRLEVPKVNTIYENVRGILQRDITSVPIRALLEDHILSEWTGIGLRIHDDRRSETCLFCTNKIPEFRLKQLRTHFDKSYNKLLEDIEDASNTLKKSVRILQSPSLPDESRFYDHLTTKYGQAKQGYVAAIHFVVDALKGIENELNVKLTKPFQVIQIATPKIEFDISKLESLNAVIEKHNAYSANLLTEVNKALEQLHNHVISKCLPRFRELKSEVKDIKKKLDDENSNKVDLDNEIGRLESELKSNRPPVDALNVDLINYLGHSELQLEYEDTGYRLKRDGRYANDLSEGEKTALAFLFFLQRLSDTSFELEKGIVMIDDPVSSLDANCLFYAFGFMKEKTKDAGQLFILTHNFQFFSLVRNWFNHINKKFRKFYQLNCGYDSGKRNASLDPLDKLLWQHESEYHYLFKMIKIRAEDSSTGRDLAADYSYPNIARRLLESFLAFRYPNKKSFHDRIESITGIESSKRTRIERYLQSGSHDCSIPESAHDPSILSETSEILIDLLKLIETADKGHYDEMVLTYESSLIT